MRNIGILIAEDELLVGEDTSDIIKEFGYNVLGIVPSGEEVINKSIELSPDLVLMDIQLKGSIDGIQAADFIHSELKIPVIFITAFSNESILDSAKISEPYAYILKPFRERELLSAIKISLYKSKIDRKMELKVEERTKELKFQLVRFEQSRIELKESEEKFRVLADQYYVGILIIQDSKVKYINQACLDIFELGESNVIEEKFDKLLELFPREDRIGIRTRVEAVMSGNKISDKINRIAFITATGKNKIVKVYSKHIQLMGNIADIITVIDISERVKADILAKNQQEQIVQADKMASLGILSAGIAHEINNPNQYIMSIAPRLKEMWEGILKITDEYYEQNGDFLLGGLSYKKNRDKISEYSLRILKNSKKINNIVNDMKKYCRLETSDNVIEIDLNKVVHSAVSLLSNMISKHTDYFYINLYPELPFIKGNFQRLEQVIINIIQNSCQALDDKSKKINLETQYDKRINKVLLRILDEGIGIPPEDISRVIDPFFTTKRDSGGTGLGLSVTSKIIEEHGGNMVIESEVNSGTTISINFPESDGVLPV